MHYLRARMLLARGNDAKDLKSLGRELDACPLDEHLVAFKRRSISSSSKIKIIPICNSFVDRSVFLTKYQINYSGAFGLLIAIIKRVKPGQMEWTSPTL